MVPPSLHALRGLPPPSPSLLPPLPLSSLSCRFASLNPLKLQTSTCRLLAPHLSAPPRGSRRAFFLRRVAAMEGEGGSAEAEGGGSGPGAADDVVVQHVVLRRDLEWPLGSLMAQGCHAAVAAIWEHREDPTVQRYCGDIDHMRKVVLEVKGETQLRNLAEKLNAAGIRHKLWVEQPENIPTCLATKPYLKSEVNSHFKKLKLCK